MRVASGLAGGSDPGRNRRDGELVAEGSAAGDDRGGEGSDIRQMPERFAGVDI